MKPKEENVISNPVWNIIAENVLLSNYIIKSPPKEKQNNALVRWCMRWFVLYYKRATRVCWLFYYQNEESYYHGNLPKGKIDLKHCKIKIHKGILNKYEYVIDLIGVKRTFHLCFTNSRIFGIWLNKLHEVHKDVWANEILTANKNDPNNNNDVNQNNEMNKNTVINNPPDELTKIIENEAKNENIEIVVNEDRSSEVTSSDLFDVNEEKPPDLTESNKSDPEDNENMEESSTIDGEGEKQKWCSDTEDNEENGEFAELLATGISLNRPKSLTCTDSDVKNSSIETLDDVDETYLTPKGIRKSNISSNSVIPQRRLSAHASDFRCGRYDSLPNIHSSVSRTGNSNIHFEILERLKAAASKRPSLVNDYDMGGFSGPKLHFNGDMT